MKTSFLVGLFLVVLSLVTFGQTIGSRTGTITIDGPAVIGFFPPVRQVGDDNPDDGVIEGTAHLSFALEDTQGCLKKSGVTARVSLETASALVVKENGRTRRLVLPKSWASLLVQARRACARHLRTKRAGLSDRRIAAGRRRIFFSTGVWRRKARPLMRARLGLSQADGSWKRANGPIGISWANLPYLSAECLILLAIRPAEC